MRQTQLTCFTGLLAFLLGSVRGHASVTCHASERPVIELTADVKPPDQVIADALARQLTAELDARGIDLCEGKSAHQPVGRVLLRVERNQAGPTTALIRIGDEVTDKRVERTMELSNIPADSRPLAVALAADELLRASWAELLMDDAPPPIQTPPRAIVTAAQRSITSKHGATRPIQFGPFGSASVFPHRVGVGAGVVFGHALTTRLAIAFRAGLEQGLTSSSEHGRVHANSTSFGTGLEYALSNAPFIVSVAADLRWLQVHYSAEASAGNVARMSNDWAVLSGWGMVSGFDVGAAYIYVRPVALLGVRPTQATDAGREVSSLGRIGGEATLGLSLRL